MNEIKKKQVIFVCGVGKYCQGASCFCIEVLGIKKKKKKKSDELGGLMELSRSAYVFQKGNEGPWGDSVVIGTCFQASLVVHEISAPVVGRAVIKAWNHRYVHSTVLWSVE